MLEDRNNKHLEERLKISLANNREIMTKVKKLMRENNKLLCQIDSLKKEIKRYEDIIIAQNRRHFK